MKEFRDMFGFSTVGLGPEDLPAMQRFIDVRVNVLRRNVGDAEASLKATREMTRLSAQQVVDSILARKMTLAAAKVALAKAEKLAKDAGFKV